MSTDKGEGISTQEATTRTTSGTAKPQSPAQPGQTLKQPPTRPQPATTPKLGEEPGSAEAEHDKKPSAKREQTSETTSPSTTEAESRPRQVIAVSASKGPTAFFNLARKFLVTDEMCDLSALEGAIVSAVDAAHLLERSKLATIVRVQTSYVTVEPKRKKQVPGSPQIRQPSLPMAAGRSALAPHPEGVPPPSEHHGRRPSGRELRRARIVITVKRTESYKRWLEENPLQAIIAGDGGGEEAATTEQAESEAHL